MHQRATAEMKPATQRWGTQPFPRALKDLPTGHPSVTFYLFLVEHLEKGDNEKALHTVMWPSLYNDGVVFRPEENIAMKMLSLD